MQEMLTKCVLGGWHFIGMYYCYYTVSYFGNGKTARIYWGLIMSQVFSCYNYNYCEVNSLYIQGTYWGCQLAHPKPYSLCVTQPGFKQSCSGSRLRHGIFARTDPPISDPYEGAGNHSWKFLVVCVWLCCLVKAHFSVLCLTPTWSPLPDAFVAVMAPQQLPVLPLHYSGDPLPTPPKVLFLLDSWNLLLEVQH